MTYDNYRSEDFRKKLDRLEYSPLDVIFTGVTGAGKSTTLNAVFEKNIAKVGNGVAPETMDLDCYRLNHWLRLWDTPGLGDDVKKDEEHKRKMTKLLRRNWLYNDIYGYVDLVIVIIEGSKRDLGTTIKLLEDVVLPNIEHDRVLVAINQSDIAMKGRNWDSTNNCPNSILKDYLDDFAKSLQDRIYRDTNLRIPLPVYYSAEKQYNIKAFLDLIINNIPSQKRPPVDVRRVYSSSSIEINKPTYFFDDEAGVVNLKLKSIYASLCTGELSINSWISSDNFSFENGWKEHHIFDTHLLGHIDGDTSIEDVDCYFEIPEGEIPIKGKWNFVFTINELNVDGKWYIIDYINAGSYYNP
ncbi:MAG: GTPase [Paludibacteraceae bacterium]|jgi:predicted GTPase|nr:GTPase [Paludibacteraceae bacterium]